MFTRFGVDILAEGVKPENLNRQELGDAIFDKLKERYEAKEKLIGPDAMRHHERMIMLSVLDSQWKDHLLSMDHLKEGIGLRGYGQHDPLVEYKKESFEIFEAMMQRFQEDTVRYLYLMQILERPAEPAPGVQPGGAGQQVPDSWRLQAGMATETEGVLHGWWPRRLTISRKRSSGASAANWSRRAWPEAAMQRRCSKLCGRRKKWAGTILALAGQGRNIRSATGRSRAGLFSDGESWIWPLAAAAAG